MESIETIAAVTLVQLQHHCESKTSDSSLLPVARREDQLSSNESLSENSTSQCCQNKRKAVMKTLKQKKTNAKNIDIEEMNSIAGTDTSSCSLQSEQIFKSGDEFSDKNIKVSSKLNKDIELARVVNKICHFVNTANLDGLTALFDSAAPNCPISVGVVPFKQKHNLRDYFINLAKLHADILIVPDDIFFVESNVITAKILFTGTRTEVVTLEYMQKCLGNKSLVDCMNLSLQPDKEISALRKLEEKLYQEGRGARKTAVGDITLFLAPDVCDDDEVLNDTQQDYIETCSNVSTLTSGSLNEIETSGLYNRKIIHTSCKWTVADFTLI